MRLVYNIRMYVLDVCTKLDDYTHLAIFVDAMSRSVYYFPAVGNFEMSVLFFQTRRKAEWRFVGCKETM